MDKIVKALKELGIPAHLLGYEYLKTALVLVRKGKTLIHQITKQLYPKVAKAHNTSSSRAERAIRHAVEIGWNRGNTDVMQAYFGYSTDPNRGKPTNSEFIATVAEHIEMENEDT